MKSDKIAALLAQFEALVKTEQEVEFWFARELQPLLGYDRWENFATLLDRAKTACVGAGQEVADHFRDVTKMVGDLLASPHARGLGAVEQRREVLPAVVAEQRLQLAGEPELDLLLGLHQRLELSEQRCDLVGLHDFPPSGGTQRPLT